MKYVDGFVLPVSRRRLDAYRRLARKAGKVFREHGALAYYECVGDDLKIKGFPSFTKLAKAKKGETVFFSFIVYRSRAQRDRVNAKVIKDPRLAFMADALPFEIKRMAYGGFRVFVEA